jgi:hypothetical protein
MRAWNCFGTQELPSHQADEKPKAPKGAWRKFKPYSNVLWIYYLFDFLLKNYKGSEALDHFMRETKVLCRNLEPGTGHWGGKFTSACDILEFCEEEGWITQAEALGLPSDAAPETVDKNEAAYNENGEAVGDENDKAIYGENEAIYGEDNEAAYDENEEAVYEGDTESKSSTSISDSEVLFLAPRRRRQDTAA